jgi:hypothetical protein
MQWYFRHIYRVVVAWYVEEKSDIQETIADALSP